MTHNRLYKRTSFTGYSPTNSVKVLKDNILSTDLSGLLVLLYRPIYNIRMQQDALQRRIHRDSPANISDVATRSAAMLDCCSHRKVTVFFVVLLRHRRP